ncbi:MAG: hypothetical protein Q4F27_00455, partial [Desulfovibrionaceae bacterium]|nr:hypothetical protein [Desulfovibrionaceae bacterium]
DRSVWITASAGLVFARCGDTFEKLYPLADQMLYEAKRVGKARFMEYQPRPAQQRLPKRS